MTSQPIRRIGLLRDQSGSASFGVGVLVAVGLVAALAGGLIGRATAGGSPKPSAVGPTNAYPTPPPAPSLAPIESLKLGETGTTETGADVTVLTWDVGDPPGWPKPRLGKEYSRAVVQFCTGEGTWNFRIRENPYLFNVVGSDGALYTPFVDIRHALEELASYNVGVIPPNTCVTGTIIFEQPEGATIDAVRFTGHGRLEWDVRSISDGKSPAPTPSYDPGSSPNPPASPAS